MTLTLVVAIPLATALAIALAGGRLGRRTLGIITTAAMALSFGAGASMIATLRDRPAIVAFIAPWLPLPGADIAFVVDSSMLAVTLAVTGVSALIALYSIDYLRYDRGLQRYFAAFSLLVAAMLIVVLASNLLLVAAGWELAGAATYLLVGHHRDDPRAAGAAMKTFVIDRIGDAALVAGIFLLLAEFHTVDIAQLGGTAIEHGSVAGAGPVLASALLLFGALAKSAQLPLHAWLPDAADAPTPVSALIQTVAVAGGVVLLMRLRSVLVPDVLQAAAVIGGLTAFSAAIVAAAQRDVRRVLAWSTISQVGLMFVGAGLGALFAARFQLIAHMLLKAVLVLGAGSVRRATADESDVARYGGLARRMPWTAGAFGIGTIALIGIPPAAGFFGIAAIVGAAFTESDAFITALVLLAAAASAFAGVRLFALVVAAPPAVPRDPPASPILPDIPLTLLALGALAFGALVISGVLPIGSGVTDEAPLWLLSATFAVVLIASAAAWLAYRHGLGPATRIEHALRWAGAGLGFDAASGLLVVRPLRWVARELDRGAESVNLRVVDAIGTGLASTSRVVRRVQPEGARAQQALILAGTVALLAYWTWSAR
ncbi:MAG TPA: proton-conducting transporter membrane subunit [Candidatus Limnocylindria bacterium]|nr:proton-conducting transporter membrane subunit [Candidatus Limnocylindria bacterium]